MQQHVGAAWRVGRSVVADHRVEPKRGLDRLALKPLAEEAGRGLGEQVQDIAFLFERELGKASSLQCAIDQRAETLADVGRCLEREAAQDFGHGLERVVVGGQGLGIAG